MEFRILGRLEAASNGDHLDIRRPKQRALLAILLLEAGKVVPTDRLIDQLWGERPPRRASHAIHVHMSQLRMALDPAGSGRMIEWCPPGYVLRVPPDVVDAHRFEALVGEGIRAAEAGDLERAEADLRSSLELWQGPPLADFAYADFAQPTIRRLSELHLAALEADAQVELALGHEQQALELARLAITEDRFRERAHDLAMRCLYRLGRQADALRAYEDYRRVLAEELGLDPSPELSRLQEQILLHDPALGPAPRTQPTGHEGRRPRNPYKGLRAFGEDDAADFFGRDDLVAGLLSTLASGARFLVLVGPSGCGKSSVVRAGLIPAVRTEALPGSRAWRVTVLVPGRRALDQLRAQLRPHDDGHAPTLLVIDQFEDLFTVTDTAQRDEFLDVLARTVTSPGGAVRVVATLRGDFYDRPLLHRTFAPVFAAGVVTVVPMTADEVAAAITEPARRAGVEVEPALLASLVADRVDQPGALPLLQFVLTRLFEAREDGVMTFAAYRSLGGLRGALTQHAEGLFTPLSPATREATMQVFVRLVRPDDASLDTRRRVALDELLGLGLDPVVLHDVLETFRRGRLLTFDRDPATGAATIEVAHEAVLQAWTRLARWIDRHRADLRRHQALAVRVADWVSSGRHDDDLLVGPRLDAYEDWMRATVVLLTAEERAYLLASTDRRRRDLEVAEHANAQRRRLEGRARRRLAAALALVAVTGAGTVVVALDPFAAPPPEVALVLEVPMTSGIDDQMAAAFDAAVTRAGLRAETTIETAATFEARVRDLSDHGVDLLVVGWNLPGRVVADHPDVHYVALEYFGADDLPNVSTAMFENQEGAYLVGAIAAMKSVTGMVGFVAAWKDPYLEAAEAGFTAGARAVVPDIDVRSTYLTETDRGFTSFNLANEAARGLYAAGADVVFHVAGRAGLGVFAAAYTESRAQGRHLWAIGNDTDQYATLSLIAPREGYNAAEWQPHVLTSLVVRYDRAIEAMVDLYGEGRLNPGRHRFGLRDGVFEIADSGGFIEDIRPAVQDLAERIVSGEIRPPAVPADALSGR